MAVVTVADNTGTISIADGNSTIYIEKKKVDVTAQGGKVTIRWDENTSVTYTAAQFISPSGTAAAIAAAIAVFLDTGAASGITGSGTTNYIPKWTGTTALGNSLMTSSSTTITISQSVFVSAASALLDMNSTSQGLLIPRMTTVEKNAIGTPATSLLVFDSTLGLFSYYTGAAWASLDTGTNDFTQGGNAFATTGTLGLTDANTLNIITNNITRIGITSGGNISMTQSVATSGTPTAFLLTSAAHTTLATTVEDIGVNFNLSATKQWAAGAITTQREFLIQAPTYAFASASTITTAATFAISAAPTAGTNATITNALALWVQSGETRLVGSGTGNTTYGLRVYNSTGTTATLWARNDGHITAGLGSFAFTIGLGSSFDATLNNTFVGVNVGVGLTSGTGNTGFGESACHVTSGSSNSAFGKDALKALTIGNQNTAVGESTLTLLTSTSQNTAVGSNALYPCTGSQNTAVGMQALGAATSADNNTAIGYQSGNNSTSGDANIFIGNGAGYYNTTVSNQLFIDNQSRSNYTQNQTQGLIYGTFNAAVASQVLRVNAFFGINMAPNAMFDLTQVVATSGSPTAFMVSGGAHTTLTASTESIGARFNFGQTKQWATGAIVTQREIYIEAPTYAFVGASTITNAATFVINAAPTAGTNATITNSYALWVQSGETRLVGSGATNATYGLRVDNSGSNACLYVNDARQVGVGIIPTSTLEVQPTAAGYNMKFNQPNGTNAVKFYTDNSGNELHLLHSGSVVFNIRGTGDSFLNAGGTGLFGIGVENPSYKLDVQTSASGSSENIRIYNTVAAANNSAASMLFSANRTTGGSTLVASVRGMITDITNTAYKGALIFSTANNGVPAERVRIDFIGGTTITQAIATTGTPTAFLVIGGAHTTLTASTESIGANFNFSAIKEFATGAITTQREILIQAPTYGFVGASVVTNAATLSISGAPIAGTNATLTNSSALWIQAGALRADGRVLQNQGADVASGTNLTLAGDGNTFEITGTTQIDLILITGWRDGAVVTLVFNESVTVRHGIATSGSNVTILLAGAANFSATANDTLTLVLCSTTAGGQAWRELARTAI